LLQISIISVKYNSLLLTFRDRLIQAGKYFCKIPGAKAIIPELHNFIFFSKSVATLNSTIFLKFPPASWIILPYAFGSSCLNANVTTADLEVSR
jgi:hypothetical protein